MNTLSKYKLLALSFLLPYISLCQNETASSTTYFSNALFNTLLAIIILLLIIILAFSTVIKNVANTNLFNQKEQEKESTNNSGITKSLSFIAFLFLGYNMSAQNQNSDLIGGLDFFTFYFLLSIIFLETLVLGLLMYQFKFLLKSKTTTATPVKIKEDSIVFALTKAVPVEEEDSILLDHDYDGIKELDNNLPPWWKYGFYLTILVAFIYIYRYHISDSGDSQAQEYEKEMAKAKVDIEEYMKTSANKVDESSVKLLTSANDVAAGKEAFIAFCATCHGRSGEGGIGPNMTDEYWMHGGSLQDVFKSIKYGWPEKGMKSWKEDLSPMQIAQVTSFIMGLKGTNPPNAKAAQGDLYTEKIIVVSDSVAVDSLNTVILNDSTKTK